MFMKRKTYQKDVDLFDIIGYKKEVHHLIINGVNISDSTLSARLEISNDRQHLSVYTEDKYCSSADINIEDIKEIKFKTSNESFELIDI